MNRVHKTAAALLIVLLIPSTAFADFRRVELKILGMDWAVCAHAVRVAIRKLPGVDSVDVSLERATADIRLRAGNTVTLPRLRQIIKDNGFTSKEATVTVTGNLIERGGKPALDVTGTQTVMLIVPDPKQPDAYQRIQGQQRAKPGQTVELRGVVESRPDQPDQIMVGAQ